GRRAEGPALEAAEVGRQIADPPTRGARRPLDRSEEPAHHPHAGVLQERERLGQQPRVEHDVLEIGAGAERLEEAHRLARDEAAEQRVAWPDEPSGGLEIELLRLGLHGPEWPLALRASRPRARPGVRSPAPTRATGR